MLIERRVAPFISAIGLALVLPPGAAALRGFAPRSIVAATVGAVLGAIGVLMGSLVARVTSLKPVVATEIVFWFLVAAVLAGSMSLMALLEMSFIIRALLLIAALLPLAAWAIPFLLPD